jgi:hypothetical protein
MESNIKNNMQGKEPHYAKMIIKKFDINTFNKKNKYGKYEFITVDSIEVKQYESLDSNSEKIEGYYEYRKYVDSPYEYYNEYDAYGNITKSDASFYNVSIGISKFYDLSGNTTKEINFDADFPFTVDMLIEKMKVEYDIDLLILQDKLDKSVVRYFDKEYLHIPIYIVENKMGLSKDLYLIDGNTGKTLYKTKRPFEMDMFNIPKPVQVEYLNSLK